MDSHQFQIGSDYAMLEYQRLLVMQIRDQASAMAIGLKMQGAAEFLNLFQTLADKPLPATVEFPPRLDHKA